MRTRVTREWMLFVSWVLFASVNAFAAVVSNERVLVIGQAGWRDQPRELAGFAGEEIVFDILIPKSIDRSTLQIQPVQISGKVALPLGEARPLEGFVNERSLDNYGLTEIQVALPKLQRKTLLALVVTTSTEPTTKVLVVRVVAYPHFDWSPIKRKLNSDGWRLIVFGKNRALRDFLQSKNVAVSSEIEVLPAAIESDAIYLGAGATSENNTYVSSPGEGASRVVLFVENAEADAGELSGKPPGVYLHKRNKTTVTEVTLPVLDRLSADPRSEEILFNLIEQQLRPKLVATP